VHDVHAVDALIERIERAAPSGPVDVRVRAGPEFSPEALTQAFAMRVLGTSLEGSRLTVEELEDERDCGACGTSWVVSAEDLAGHVVLCPVCGTPSPAGDGVGIELVEVTERAA
jgi:Zn finger protein HypA/HybF involved in hydrogenase expression